MQVAHTSSISYAKLRSSVGQVPGAPCMVRFLRVGGVAEKCSRVLLRAQARLQMQMRLRHTLVCACSQQDADLPLLAA